MQNRIWLIAAFLMAGVATSGCAPLVIGAAGAAGVVIADDAMEKKRGDDGLF